MSAFHVKYFSRKLMSQKKSISQNGAFVATKRSRCWARGEGGVVAAVFYGIVQILKGLSGEI
jgi:hypothetical protein